MSSPKEFRSWYKTTKESKIFEFGGKPHGFIIIRRKGISELEIVYMTSQPNQNEFKKLQITDDDIVNGKLLINPSFIVLQTFTILLSDIENFSIVKFEITNTFYKKIINNL